MAEGDLLSFWGSETSAIAEGTTRSSSRYKKKERASIPTGAKMWEERKTKGYEEGQREPRKLSSRGSESVYDGKVREIGRLSGKILEKKKEANFAVPPFYFPRGWGAK